MKLLNLRIGQYRVLRNINIDFDRKNIVGELNPEQKYALDFLAGVNGTGKTTVLQILSRLFATLQTENYSFPIPIEVTYSITKKSGEEQVIAVTNIDPSDDQHPLKQLVYHEDQGEERAEKIRPENLPAQVVIYTTGNEVAWQRELATETEKIQEDPVAVYDETKEEQRYLNELPGHKSPEIADDDNDLDAKQNILYIYQDRFPLVTLCGLLASIKDKLDKNITCQVLQPVFNAIELEDLRSFSLRIRQHQDLTPVPQVEIIANLENAANQIIQSGADRLLIFEIEQQITKYQQDKLSSIFGLYDSPILLFQFLNLLYEHRPYYDAPLQEVNIFLRKRIPESNQPAGKVNEQPTMLHLFDWLSDGERSFLGRMALFALFRADNLLIILDEPEVHFNDVWKREIVHMLDQIMEGCASHAIISTHSSIALTDVSQEDILVFRRLGQYVEGDEAVMQPGIRTLGADPSDIMVHVFGTKFASGAHSVCYIREKIARSESRDELEKLQNAIAPGYWFYRVQLEIDQLGEQNLQ
jgi:predicted ATPase